MTTFTSSRLARPIPPLGHEALLTLTRKAEGAARDGDRKRLQFAAARLLQALLDHLGAEQKRLRTVAFDESTRLLHGQQGVLDIGAELLHASRSCDLPTCDKIAQRLVAQLSLQIREERTSFGPEQTL